MSGFRRRSFRVALAAAWLSTTAAWPQAACTGPETLSAQVRQHPTTENAVTLGGWFASHKQFSCAVETFRAALRRDPQSAQLHYLAGLALIGGGHPAEALPELHQSEHLQPGAIKPHLLLAVLYEQGEKYDKAEEEWKAALAIDPSSEQALEGLSSDLLEQRDYIDVIGLLRHAPRTEKLAVNLSKAYGMLNDLRQANAVLTEALRVSPKSVSLANALAVVLVKQIRYQEAIDLLERTLKANPGDVDAQIRLLRVLVLTQHNDSARTLGPKLLAALPKNTEVIYLNGLLERAMGNDAQAKMHLEQAVALDPNFSSYRYSLGTVLVNLHEWAEAKDQLEKAIAMGEKEAEAHYELAKALRGLGDDSGAAAEIKQYQDMKASEEIALEAATTAAQGDKDMAEGDVKSAIEHYREASEKMPSNGDYKYKLAVALQKSGDTEKERAALEEAVKLNPGLAAAQQELGFLLARSGDAAGAIEHFRLAVTAEPAWTDAWINLAAELAESGQFSEARKAAATALRVDPENPQAKKLSDRLAQDPAAQQETP